jgi:hypothetical protein
VLSFFNKTMHEAIFMFKDKNKCFFVLLPQKYRVPKFSLVIKFTNEIIPWKTSFPSKDRTKIGGLGKGYSDEGHRIVGGGGGSSSGSGSGQLAGDRFVKVAIVSSGTQCG